MKEKKNKKCTSIGGQALIEGVMMRGRNSMAMAVRDQDGIIRKETKRITPPEKKNFFVKLPIVRGVVNFFNSMIDGMACLMRSAEVYGEAEPSNLEKWFAKKFKIDIYKVVMGLSLIIAVALAIGLFILLPQVSRFGIEKLISSIKGNYFEFDTVSKNFIEGGIRIIVFVLYIVLCSLVPDVKRTFMYHGAEHKTISCYEQGLPLTPENAKTCSRIHDRCGTTFMVFVIVLSILVFAGVEAIFLAFNIELYGIVRSLVKIASLPLVAGLSYELLKLLAKTKSVLVLPLKWPGMLLQKITTKEPTDDMLEVSIEAFNEVLKMDADLTIKEQKFITMQKAKLVTEEVVKTLSEHGIDDVSDAEWIVALSADLKRSEVYSEKVIPAIKIDKINKIVEERITGKPLWYCIGDTDFMGYTIKVNPSVLIPRPETENLVEESLKYIDSTKKVLDLCTGSGAIAISVALMSNANVTASDISSDAISTAKENALLNNANVNFVLSDLFNNIDDKFDVIISNPPYIKSIDINSLQREVKDFEPLLALDGGSDGLYFYRLIASNCKNYLNESGVLLLEVGVNQADDVKNLFVDAKNVEIIKDLQGVDRIIKVLF